VRRVEEALITRVGVDRAHEALFDPEGVVEDLHHRREAVGGAGCVRNDVVFVRVVEIGVDPDAEGEVGIFRRSGDDDLLRARGDVLARTGLVEEETGRLEDDGNALATPIEVGGVFLGCREDAVAFHGDGLIIILDRAVVATRGGVVLEEVSESLVVGEVVDRDNFLELFVGHGAKDHASDASEAVDSVGGHRFGYKRVS
jgi:hypothetical protein